MAAVCSASPIAPVHSTNAFLYACSGLARDGSSLGFRRGVARRSRSISRASDLGSRRSAFDRDASSGFRGSRPRVTPGAEHYNYFRDYDPTIGRYIESDPLGIFAGLQTYAYANGRALSRFDPLGLFAVDWRPKDFNESRRPPDWVVQLRGYGRRLEDRINQLCAKDRDELRAYFDKWVVGYDPTRVNPYTKGNRSNFTPKSFKQDDVYFIFVHEFRHTMDANVKLRRNSYLGSLLSGHHGDEPDEKDADSFATKLLGTCPCPSY